MRKSKRVVITGIGVVSPLGIGKDDFWKAIVQGKSGISKVSLFDTRDADCHYAGEVKKFNPYPILPDEKVLRYSRHIQFPILSSYISSKDAGHSKLTPLPEKTGVIFGALYGEGDLEGILEALVNRTPMNSLEKEMIANVFLRNLASIVAGYFKIRGISSVISTACAGGNYAISYAFDLIRNGFLDSALAGSSDCLSKASFFGFNRLYAMAPKICQPFDKNRKGMLMGEGSATLFLETLDSALKRGANIYAEILGYGLSCDAHSLAIPKQEGIAKAISKALVSSGINTNQVDYISAHGTGTYANDKAECAAIKQVFGKRHNKIPVSSIKSMIGHAMSAASSIQAVACCLVLQKGIIPPTINFKTRDPECDIDCVPNKSRKKDINVILSNSFAFGGNNCCLVFKKWSKR
jgi:3-oxoacyl-[acyl-carrier-protein] synthase II